MSITYTKPLSESPMKLSMTMSAKIHRDIERSIAAYDRWFSTIGKFKSPDPLNEDDLNSCRMGLARVVMHFPYSNSADVLGLLEHKIDEKGKATITIKSEKRQTALVFLKVPDNQPYAMGAITYPDGSIQDFLGNLEDHWNEWRAANGPEVPASQFLVWLAATKEGYAAPDGYVTWAELPARSKPSYREELNPPDPKIGHVRLEPRRPWKLPDDVSPPQVRCISTGLHEEGLTVGKVYVIQDVDCGVQDNAKQDYIIVNDQGQTERYISELFERCTK